MSKHRNENRPGYKKTKVGWIPEEWKDPRLEVICSMKSGETITSKSISDNAEYRCFGGNGVRGFTATYTHDGKFVLIGRQGALCGNIHLVSGKFYASEHAIVTTASKMVNLFWFAESLKLLKLNRHTESSAQPGLSVSKILRIRIPLPSFPEQKAIASVLECWDRAIQKYEEKIEKKKNIKKGLMQRLLSGKHRLPGFSVEWERSRFIDLVHLQRGFDLPQKERKQGNVPVYASNGLIGYHNVSKVCSPGIVTGRSGSIGKVSFVQTDFWPLNTTLFVTDFKTNDPLYAFYFMNNLKLERLANGTGVPTLNRNDVHPQNILLPSFPEQKAIASVLSSADSEIKSLEKKLALVKGQKKYLLNNLVTGTIRLPEFSVGGGIE